MSGADHSIPLTTDVFRVTTILGSVEYTVPQLPVTYNLADLHGNLTISDSSGRALYRWRLHPSTQSSVAEHSQAGSQPTYHLDWERRSPSISAPSSYRTAKTSPSGGCSNKLDDHQNSNSDVKPMPEDLHGARRLRSGKVREWYSIETSSSRFGSESSEDTSTSSPRIQGPKRQTQRRIKGRFNVSGDSGTATLLPDEPLPKKRRSVRPVVATTREGEV